MDDIDHKGHKLGEFGRRSRITGGYVKSGKMRAFPLDWQANPSYNRLR